MTKLDSILKSRDITLSTKVHLVKAIVFPVVMYGCESWTIKKAERHVCGGFKFKNLREEEKLNWNLVNSMYLSKSQQMVTAAMKLKDTFSLEEKP